MTKDDFKNGADKCSGCGEPVGVICKCEVANFRNNGYED
jgi:hypothetical protein